MCKKLQKIIKKSKKIFKKHNLYRKEKASNKKLAKNPDLNKKIFEILENKALHLLKKINRN